jgi:hypothetical protein
MVRLLFVPHNQLMTVDCFIGHERRRPAVYWRLCTRNRIAYQDFRPDHLKNTSSALHLLTDPDKEPPPDIEGEPEVQFAIPNHHQLQQHSNESAVAIRR